VRLYSFPFFRFFAFCFVFVVFVVLWVDFACGVRLFFTVLSLLAVGGISVEDVDGSAGSAWGWG